MDVGGAVVKEDGKAIGTFCRLRVSLQDHMRELEVINRKVGDPRVPQGKKEKLAFRAMVITRQVLPKIHNRLEHMQPDFSCM